MTYYVEALEHTVDSKAIHFCVTVAFPKLVVGGPVPAVVELTFQRARDGHQISGQRRAPVMQRVSRGNAFVEAERRNVARRHLCLKISRDERIAAIDGDRPGT